MNNNHTCEREIIPTDSVHFNKMYIATEIIDMICADIRLAPRNIRQIMVKKYGFLITYKKAWNVRQKALELLFGEWTESFSLLSPYLTALVAFNHGSYVKMDTSYVGEGKYSVDRFFWSFAPAIEAFKHCRPVICVDGTHLKGKYQVALLIAVGIDGDNHLLRKAYGLVDKKNNDNWAWFMSCIRGVTQKTELCVISDRHIGIMNAMKTVEWSPPNAYHRVCCRHLASNFNKRVGDKHCREQLKRISYQHQKKKFTTLFNDFKVALRDDPSTVRWLDSFDPESWSLAFDEGGRRWGSMTTNSSECFNNVLRSGRDLPVTALVDYTLKQSNDFFIKRRGKYSDHRSHYVPKVSEKLDLLKKKCSRHDIEVYDRQKMIAKITTARKRNVHVINVSENTCTCGKWQLFHYPCSHLLALCREERLSYKQFVAPEYFMSSFRNTWAPTFNVIPSQNTTDWPAYEGGFLVPNFHFQRTKKGRNPTQRILNEMDGRFARPQETNPRDGGSSSMASSSRARTGKKCSICGEMGHNKETCNR